MQAEIVSVGTELLLGEITDTNAQYISKRLKELGIDVYRRITIGDNPARLTASFKEAMSRAEIIISTGGLGPTSDDITAQSLADSLDVPLLFSEEAFSMMMEWYKKRERTPGSFDRKQAMIVSGGSPLRNREGTAPGQAYISQGKMVFLLPGPPHEMIPMFENEVVPLIVRHASDIRPLYSRSLKIIGLGESRVQEMVADLMTGSNPSLAPYAGEGEVRLRIAARGRDETESMRLIASMEDQVRQRLKEYIYGVDDETLESAVGGLLKRRGMTLAISESVTGGLLCHRLTNVPGSSSYLKLGLVAYSPGVKSTFLGVSRQAVNDNESVNPEIARGMAEGVRRLAGTTLGLGLTGFAGPGGGTPQEPVGTVYCALSSESGTIIDRQTFPGSRVRVKHQASQRALYLLWHHLKRLRGA